MVSEKKIFMGIVLQKTKLAEQLLEAMGDLFGNVRGGLAVSTTISNNKVAPNMTKPII
jgi:TRAP-type mannitol/chloroaromatic compound transport system permease large subunit